MRLGGLLAIVLLALAEPVASAGTEADPDVEDPVDREEPWNDVLALWLDDHPDGVKFTVKVAGLPAPRAGLLFEVGWGLRDNVAIGFDGARTLRSSVDTSAGWTGEGRGKARLDDALLHESFTAGSPAYFSAVIPAARFGFEEGDVLARLRVLSTYWDAQAEEWIIGADRAGTITSSYRIGAPAGGLFPIPVPAWMVPALVVACTVGGLVGGLALARWSATRRTKRAADAKPVDARVAPPPPPGQRFQHAPGRK